MKKLKSILLVDDYEPTNYLHKMFLEEANCADHIEAVRNGPDALSFLRSAINNSVPIPELIFLDINMPLMNGWEFLEAYKKLMQDVSQQVVVIMLTASINPDDKKKADEMPEVRGFLNKPFTPEKLEQVLKENFNF